MEAAAELAAAPGEAVPSESGSCVRKLLASFLVRCKFREMAPPGPTINEREINFAF